MISLPLAVKAAAALNAAGFDVAAAVEMLLNRLSVEANGPLICFGILTNPVQTPAPKIQKAAQVDCTAHVILNREGPGRASHSSCFHTISVIKRPVNFLLCRECAHRQALPNGPESNPLLGREASLSLCSPGYRYLPREI